MCVCVCYVVVAVVVVVVAVHTIRLLDVVTVWFLPFTYVTGLLLLVVRQLLAQMSTTREGANVICSVSQSDERKKNTRKKIFFLEKRGRA